MKTSDVPFTVFNWWDANPQVILSAIARLNFFSFSNLMSEFTDLFIVGQVNFRNLMNYLLRNLACRYFGNKSTVVLSGTALHYDGQVCPKKDQTSINFGASFPKMALNIGG